MSGTNYIDAGTSTVVSAGHHTAGTASAWETWGGRSRSALGVARTQVRSERIAIALEEYAGEVVSGASRVGQRVTNLGVNTSSAATVVDNADAASAGLLQQHGVSSGEQGSVLSRPIDGTQPF